MSQRETAFSAEIRLALGREARHARLFRNPSGVYWGGRVLQRTGDTVTLAHAQKVQAGLTTGAADLIGWTTITVTPEWAASMMGKPIAIFTSGEVKVKGGRIEPDQRTWADAVNAAGGRAGFLWSVEDARRLVAP